MEGPSRQAAATVAPAPTPSQACAALAPAGGWRCFSTAGSDPYAEVEWVRRDAVIHGEGGQVVFEQLGVEAPSSWSEIATRIVASKYFRGAPGAPERETSVRQLVSRVVDTLGEWGRRDGYFASREEAGAFCGELAWLLLRQRAAFNSPVWFNVGIEARPQCSACFINSVDDTMDSILGLARTEGMLFKYGSGSGSNLSSLRGSMEPLSTGGTASGPLSFMRGLDAFAGAIKSGGRTRRAAKMVLLDVDHPDVVDFIRSKQVEEGKARALVAAGYEAGFAVAGGAYDSVGFQNANHSLRLSDAFMAAVDADGEWTTRAVLGGAPVATYRARDLLRWMAEAAWECGDPGVQLSTTIDGWHTCPASGPIRASNPCSEFLFLDDSACNLASLNLLSFWRPESGFDCAGFAHAAAVLLTAQEILVDRGSYPTAAIEETSRRFRPLGLGFANLGALLMAAGVPYDSPQGRGLAAAVTALLTGAAYAQSSRMAAARGAFAGFADNRQPLLSVLARHRRAAEALDGGEDGCEIAAAARAAWAEAAALAEAHGARNAQVTVLAPTGTIAFMMDCDTTGVEPDLALVKHKQLVGGGSLRIVNRTVPAALDRLGYPPESREAILEWVEEHGTVEGAPDLDEAHLPVFDCAFRTPQGTRSIHHRGHLAMLAALQPFISGAISKTINVPAETTVEEIESIYRQAWTMGIKAVAVYRDGCKSSQPLTSGGKRRPEPTVGAAPSPVRRRLPDERRAITHKFSIDQYEGYVTVGLFDDGQPGEIFLVMAKEGSTISGLMDAFATAISIALQHGVPLQALVDKFTHTRFEPSGFTRNPAIPIAKSITDYIFRWLASKFLDADGQRAAGVLVRDDAAGGDPGDSEAGRAAAADPAAAAAANGGGALFHQDAPSCHACGSLMVRNGSCYRCLNCGATSGCS
ncbi:MAG TPA: vitamin B12-dependent ribonucleotide reductase [Thermoanaerobaculia bacterium]|nr:vitamin B12-dependent ribonucleotide reductase [Thermoanaerobaculia bacterium]